jgi:cobalt-zinc-cadmium efflux system outer membrane protein
VTSTKPVTPLHGLRLYAWIAFLIASLCSAAVAQTTRVTLEQALQLALINNSSIQAARTQVDQNKAQEITASLRPNPLLSWDSQFVPFFNPSLFSTNTLDTLQQVDIGAGYLIERGGKRLRRQDAARNQTHVTAAQIADMERTLNFNVAQQFIGILLAESNLEFASQFLKSFEQTVKISQDRFQAGDISKNDFLKIKVQLLQFQTDVNSARLAKAQALTSLRQLISYDAVPRDYDVEGDLAYQPVKNRVEDLQVLALQQRPDLRAAQLGVTAAESQVALAKANAKQDLNVAFNFSHVSAASTGSMFFNIPLAIFNRNQGEIARTKFSQTQAEFTSKPPGKRSYPRFATRTRRPRAAKPL